jgi:hypothetical protein
LEVADVTVTLPPLAVKVPDAVPLVPTTTLPMPIEVGETASWGVAFVVPVPESGIVSVGLGAFEVIVTFPLALPAAPGVKLTLKVAACPAARLTGAVMPLSENPDPLAAI